MKQFIDALKFDVTAWRDQDYPSVYPESRNILKYVSASAYLRRPQIEAFETYVYLKEVLGNRALKVVVPEILPREQLIDSL